MRRTGTVLALLALAGTTVPTVVAHAAAAPPGGRIYYSAGALLPNPDRNAGAQVWSVNPDGTDFQQLTHVARHGQAGGPDVSPDGTQVLYVSNPRGPFQVWMMQADGSGQHRVVADPHHDAFVPRWTPDGSHVVFTRCRQPFGFVECTTAVAGVDGSALHDLTNPHWADFSSSVGPDGSVAFSSDRNGFVQSIYRTSLAGERARRITPATLEAFWPDYRPDGNVIVFGDNWDRPSTNLWTMRPNGSGLQQITHVAPNQNLAFARYSPDGRHLVADFFDGSKDWLVTLNADGSGLTKIVENELSLADWGTES